MKRIIITLFALVFTGINADAQIKIVGDDYFSNLTASKSYYEKDVDFDRYFPTMDREKISLMHPNLINSVYELDRNYYSWPGGHDGLRSVYLYKNLTGDTIYLSKDYVISRTCYHKDLSGTYEKPSISFCVETKVPSESTSGGGQDTTGWLLENIERAVYKTMPAGYYVIDGYVFCTDNEDVVRGSYGLPIIEYKDEHSYWYREDRIKYSIKKLKNEILKYDNDVNVTKYLRYIIFRSMSTNDVFYISLIDGYVGLKEDKNIFRDMMPLRFYSEAISFVGKEVKIKENIREGEGKGKYKVKIVKDEFSDNLVKLADDSFIVRDVVMKDNKYYIVMEGANTGSFALNIRWIYGEVNTDRDLFWNYDDHNEYLPYIKNSPSNSHRQCRPIKGETSEVHYIYIVNEDEEESFGFSIIKIEDLALLDKRAKVQKAQLEEERKLKERQQKQAEEKAKAAYRQQMITKHGALLGEMVANKQIAIDMTKDMCRDAWGTPMNTYRTTTKYGQSEVWCYNYKTRVYFYNGKVVQIDD